MWWTLLPVALASDVLFVGNSYVQVGNLDAVTRAALDQAGDQGEAAALVQGGFRWVDHVDRAETSGSRWDAALRDPASSWTWGILQEQSEIPGLDPGSPDQVGSAVAAETLDGWIEARGGETVLLMTWGRRDGDPAFPSEYPDYATMQARLADGYLATRDALSTAERPVWVAPVGLAWQVVHDDHLDVFPALYQADGSHPAAAGTWLAACVITATLTGADPRTLEPPPALDPALAAVVADAAADVVLDGRTGGRPLAYPWEGDRATPPPASSAGAEGDQGCGCAGAGAGGAPGMIAILALLRRRHRHRPG